MRFRGLKLEIYTIKQVIIKEKGNQIALVEEAQVKVDLDNIEVNIADTLLSNDTIGLLNLSTSNPAREVEITGNAEGRTLVIQNAMLSTFSFDAVKGEPIHLRNITFRGLRIVWIIQK
jgi:hypothetical protein